MYCLKKKNVQHKIWWWKVENEWVKNLEICFKICWLRNFKCRIVHQWCWWWSRGKELTRLLKNKGSGFKSWSCYWLQMLAKAWTNACIGLTHSPVKIYTISRKLCGTPCLLRDKLWLQKSFKKPVFSPFQLEHSSGQSSTPSGPRILCRVCECGGSINTDL